VAGAANYDPVNLNDRQRAFCEEYLVDFNATRAAIRAGYSPKAAPQQGWHLLNLPKVLKELDRLKGERRQRIEANQNNVVQELISLGLYDPADIAGAEIGAPADIARLPEHIRRAITGWKWDRDGRFVLELADKARALELLGKHLAMFVDRHEHSGRDGGPIEISDTERAQRIRALLDQALKRITSDPAGGDA